MTDTAILVAPDANRKQLQDLAPGRITEIYETSPTRVGAILSVIERDASKGKFGALVLPNLRVGTGIRPLLKFLRVLADLEIRIVSIEQPGLVLDESQAQLLRFLDELLADERKSNIRTAVERARREGRGPGRPRATIPARVFDLADQGLSLRSIARETGLGASTVGRALAARRVLHPHPQVSESRKASA